MHRIMASYTELRSKIVAEIDTETRGRGDAEKMNMLRMNATWYYLPHNQRSGKLLKRLGFVAEGYARDYLMINGQWEDRILTSLINPNWKSERATF